MDDRLARGHDGGEVRATEARPDDEQRIAASEVLGDHRRLRVAAHPGRERVRLGHRALALEGRHDRRPDQLGDRHQRVRGFGVQDALAGPDERVLRTDEPVGRFLDRPVVGPRAAPTDDPMVDGPLVWLGEDILGKLDHRGARAGRSAAP